MSDVVPVVDSLQLTDHLFSRSAESLQFLVDTITDASDNGGAHVGQLHVVGLVCSTHSAEWLRLILFSLFVIFVQAWAVAVENLDFIFAKTISSVSPGL